MRQQHGMQNNLSLLTYIQHNHIDLQFSTSGTSSQAILLDFQVDKAINRMRGRIILNKVISDRDYRLPVYTSNFLNGKITFSYKEKTYSSAIKFKPSGDDFSRETGICTAESLNRVYDILLNDSIEEEGRPEEKIEVRTRSYSIPFEMTVALGKEPVVNNFAKEMILDKMLDELDSEIMEIMQKLNPVFLYTDLAPSRKYYGNFCVIDKKDNFFPIVYLDDLFIYTQADRKAFSNTLEKEIYKVPDLILLQEFHEKKIFSFDYPKMMSFPFSFEYNNEKSREYYAFLIVAETGQVYSKADLNEKEIYFDQIKMFRDIHQYVFVKKMLTKHFRLCNFNFTSTGQFLELHYKGYSEKEIIHFVKILEKVNSVYSCSYTIDPDKLKLNQRQKERIRQRRTIDGKNVKIHDYKVYPGSNDLYLTLKFNLKDLARQRLYSYIKSLIM